MALTITIELSDAQVTALRHDLPGDAGITDWVHTMVDGKVHNCEKRMANEALGLARAGAIAPKDLADLSQSTLAEALTKLADYKDRAARDAGLAVPGTG
jgi:hypothetical protein